MTVNEKIYAVISLGWLVCIMPINTTLGHILTSKTCVHAKLQWYDAKGRLKLVLIVLVLLVHDSSKIKLELLQLSPKTLKFHIYLHLYFIASNTAYG